MGHEKNTLLLIGELRPQANTDVLRDGDDFGSGDTITFTFSQSNLIVDFEVSVAVQDSAINF